MISKLQLRRDPLSALIGLYLLWCGFNLLLSGRLPIAEAILWKWTLLAAIYLIIRLSPRKEWVLWALTAVGTVQVLYAAGQLAGYIASNHRLFPVTGFMGNPGQLGGFQAVVFLTAALLTVKTQSRKLRLFLLYPLLALIAYSLYLADSRAGWVAVIIGLTVLFWAEIRRMLTARRWLLAPILLAVVLSAVALFNYRSESAKGRLLIWRVSADMVADKPLTGHGAGGFNQEYMLYQARYFEQHPDSEFLMVADNAAYPYNEFLHVLVEQGLIGVLLFLAVIVAAFVTTTDRRMLAPLAGLLAFSLFSYPSYKFGLLILFPLLLGLGGDRQTPPISPRWRYGLLSAALLLAAAIGVGQLRFYNRAQVNSRILMRGYDRQAADFMTANFNRLRSDLRFNSMFLYWMTSYPEMADECKFRSILPSCENWCDLGDYYVEKGAYDEAERYYIMAAQMIPTRLRPNYLLWKLYLEQGKVEQAARIAEHILSQPLKVENTFTLRAKGEVKRYYAR